MDIDKALGTVRSIHFWAAGNQRKWKLNRCLACADCDSRGLWISANYNSAVYFNFYPLVHHTFNPFTFDLQELYDSLSLLKRASPSLKQPLKVLVDDLGMTLSCGNLAVRVRSQNDTAPFLSRSDKLKEHKQSMLWWSAASASSVLYALSKTASVSGDLKVSAVSQTLFFSSQTEFAYSFAVVPLSDQVQYPFEIRMPRRTMISAMSLCRFYKEALIGANEHAAVIQIGRVAFYVDYESEFEDRSDICGAPFC